MCEKLRSTEQDPTGITQKAGELWETTEFDSIQTLLRKFWI